MRKGQRRRARGRSALGSGRVLFAMAALTLLGLGAVVAIATLASKGGGEHTPRETDAAGHEVEATSAGPDIHFAARGVDFGVVPLNKEVSYSFSFANVGNDVLRIQDLQVRVVEGC